MRRVVILVAAGLALAVVLGMAPSAQAYPPYGRGFDFGGGSFSQAAAEVRATHSRYGYNTHPRSFFNTPDIKYYQPYYQPYYRPYNRPSYGYYYEQRYGFGW